MSTKCERTTNPIRAISEKITKQKRDPIPGKPVIPLSLGDPRRTRFAWRLRWLPRRAAVPVVLLIERILGTFVLPMVWLCANRAPSSKAAASGRSP